MSNQPLNGKSALVCGASEGIGAAIAAALANAGAELLLVSRRAVALERIASALPGKHSVWECDFSDPVSVDTLATIIAARPRLDIVVINAGGPAPKPPLETSPIT